MNLRDEIVALSRGLPYLLGLETEDFGDEGKGRRDLVDPGPVLMWLAWSGAGGGSLGAASALGSGDWGRGVLLTGRLDFLCGKNRPVEKESVHLKGHPVRDDCLLVVVVDIADGGLDLGLVCG